MEIRNRFDNLRLKLMQASRLKLFIFSFLGLVVLALISEGFYFLYTKNMVRELPDGSKPSTILGRELAITPLGTYEECEAKELCNLNASIGVREIPGGQIVVGGYYKDKTANSLIMEVKGKEISINYNTETVWNKFETKYFERKGFPLEELKEGDRLDVICFEIDGELRAIGVLAIY